MKGNEKKKMLIGAITILFSLVLFSFTMISNAEEVTVVGTWDISADDGESNVTATLYNDGNFVISGTGDMRDYNTSSDVLYKDKIKDIKTVTIENGVTRIGNSAFAYCIMLTSIDIPNSVKSIGRDAFENCISLTSIEIPVGMTSIEDFAFFNCESITSINIPNSITNIGYMSFSYCKNLININVDENNEKYSSVNGVLFNKNRTQLICYSAGKEEKQYTIPNSVKIIGDSAFYFCTYLENINISDSVKSIGGLAFYECKGLRNIEIPSSVTSIRVSAFSDCYFLENIKVDENNTNYSSEGGVLFNKDKTQLICYPAGKEEKQYTIPNSVTSIGDDAFYFCTGLENIEISSSVISIGSGAFKRCKNLINIEIPSSVTNIGSWTFVSCYSLKNIQVDENNTNYRSEGGVLFNKDKTKLICYPAGKKEEQYEIPLSVTNFATDAFKEVEFWMIIEQNANSIILPELIMRAKDKSDILYSEDIVLKNCNFDEDGKNLLINNEKIQAGEYATIQINSGDLEGLTFYITNGVWDMSKKGDKSVLAILSKDGVLTISGQGAMQGFSKSPYYEVRDRISSVQIQKGVTSIGYSAFTNCRNLKMVDISEGVTNIAYGAFFGCSSLTSVEIPNSVTSIEGKAFEKCSSLTSIVIPNSVTSIGDDAFYFCKDLIIYCKDNSYAKQYAEENSIKYVLDNLGNDPTDSPENDPTDSLENDPTDNPANNPIDNIYKTSSGTKNNNSSFSASTTATRKLPYAGAIQNVVLPTGVVLLVITSVGTYFGYKKYRAIK